MMGIGSFGPMNDLAQQVNVVKAIPGSVLMYWPAWFTFSFVEYIEGMVINLVPQVDRTAGTLVNAGLRGMTRVVQMVTWDAVKHAGVGSV